MDLSEQELAEIEVGIDNLTQLQLDQIEAKRLDTSITPRDVAKWIVKKLNDWL